jgi:hypothetical protein
LIVAIVIVVIAPVIIVVIPPIIVIIVLRVGGVTVVKARWPGKFLLERDLLLR